MIHYHGSPLSGPSVDKARFWAGRHALVPFPYQADLAVISEVCQSFIFDNGAFTVWKQGGQLDTEGYYRWVEDWNRHPSFEWALIPDVIDGSEDDNDRLLGLWPQHLRGVPVWHLHESEERLCRLAESYPTVALGSSGDFSHPGAHIWWERIGVVMSRLCDEHGRPPCKFHGLRMLAPKVFTKLPLASADSTNACMNAGSKGRFGMYVPVSAWQRASVIADRIEANNSAPAWGHTGVTQHADDFAI